MIEKIQLYLQLKLLKIVYSKDLRNATEKLIVGKDADNLYDGDKVIIVNFNDHIFEQRIIVTRILGYYLIDAINN